MSKAATRNRHAMKNALLMTGNILIAVWFLWHVVAIGVYAIPSKATDRVSLFLRDTINPVTSPYVLLTSQWQQWNLFSPDPLRRVTQYSIDVQEGNTWRHVVTLSPGYYPWWRHATHFKLLINVMEGENPELSEHFIQSLCPELKLDPGSTVRVQYMVYIIPWTQQPESAAWWHAWKPKWDIASGFTTTCL